VVFVPDAQVVLCGDLFWKKTLPNLIDGTTDKWSATDAKLAMEVPKGTFVPGHGDVGNAADVQEFAGYINDLRAMMTQPVQDALMGDALINAVMPGLKQKYGPGTFLIILRSGIFWIWRKSCAATSKFRNLLNNRNSELQVTSRFFAG